MELRSDKVLTRLKELKNRKNGEKDIQSVVKNINVINESLMRLYTELRECSD